MSHSSGFGVLLIAETTKGCRIASSSGLEIPTRLNPGGIPKLEVKSRQRGIEAVHRLHKELAHGGVVDEYLSDQIIIFMALAMSGVGPPIAIERGLTEPLLKKRRCEVLVGQVSLHTETAMRVAEMMLRDIEFSTEKVEGGGILVVCERYANDE
jgi:RNA 3'-terminal phosphate cyclase